MNTKLFSVRSVLSEAFSMVFSVAALPLIFVLGLIDIVSEAAQFLDLKMVPATKIIVHNLIDTFGVILIIGFLFVVVSLIVFLTVLYGYISTRISLLIIDKKSIMWSNIVPSKIILMRFFYKMLLLLVIIILILSLSGILVVISRYFNVFIQFILIFTSIGVFIIGFSSLIKFSLTSYFIIENISVIGSFKKSWNITKGYSLKLFGIIACIAFVDVVISIVAKIFLMVIPGFIWLVILLKIIAMSFVSAINYLAFARIYRILTNSSATHSSVE